MPNAKVSSVLDADHGFWQLLSIPHLAVTVILICHLEWRQPQKYSRMLCDICFRTLNVLKLLRMILLCGTRM